MLGLTYVGGGDDRIWNNIIIGRQNSETDGLSAYDSYPLEEGYARNADTADKPHDTTDTMFASSIKDNMYFNKAKSCEIETSAVRSR